MGTMQTSRSWHRLPLPNVVAAFLLSAFIVGYVAPAAVAAPGQDGDFSVTLASSPPPATSVNVGTNVTYTATVTQDAASTVDNSVQLSVTLPAGLNFSSASGGCTGGATTTCNLGPFDHTVVGGDSRQVQVVATAATPGTHDVTASLTGANPTADPDSVNDTDTVSTTVNPAADLALTKSAAPTSAFAGQDVTFTLTVHNNGPSPAANVVVTDTLPAGLTFKSSGSGCTAAGQSVTCPATASLGFPGADLVHTIVATVAPSAAGSLQNTASVSSPTFDPVASNNTANATVAVTAPPAELDVTIADAPDPVAAGGDITYTVVVHNAGPNDAPNVAVAASVPAETTFVSADNGGTLNGSAVNWTIPSIAKDASVTLTYVVSVAADVTATSLSSTATLTYGGDTTPADNTATADTAVGAEADLVIVIAADDLNPGKDGAVTFSIVVGNAGPQDVSGAVVEANLPKGVSFDAATDPSLAIAAPNAYDPATGRWDPVDLIAGGSLTFTLSGTVTTANPVTVTADAILPNGYTDPTPSNATDSVTLNQADTGGNGGGNGGGGAGGGTGGSAGAGGTGGTNEGTAFTGFTASQLMPWLAFFMILGLSSVEFARRRGGVLPVGSTYGFEPWIT